MTSIVVSLRIFLRLEFPPERDDRLRRRSVMPMRAISKLQHFAHTFSKTITQRLIKLSMKLHQQNPNIHYEIVCVCVRARRLHK